MTQNRRTPAQLLSAKQAEIDKLNARVAAAAAKEDPIFLPIAHALDNLKKCEMGARKTLGNNKQGATARIRKHLIWIERIKDEETAAGGILSGVKQLRKKLKILLASFVKLKKKPTLAQVAAKVKALLNTKPDQAESESENA